MKQNFNLLCRKYKCFLNRERRKKGCNPSYLGGGDKRISNWGGPRQKAWNSIWKITKAAEGIAQVVECLPSWCWGSYQSEYWGVVIWKLLPQSALLYKLLKPSSGPKILGQLSFQLLVSAVFTIQGCLKGRGRKSLKMVQISPLLVSIYSWKQITL
jgi:hypothetical protein